MNINLIRTPTLSMNTQSLHVSNNSEMFSDYSKSSYSGSTTNKLVDTYWNITDSMSREDQLSFAASVITNRIIPQGIAGENESFLRNISNKFSSEEIDTLKSEIKNLASEKQVNEKELNLFMSNFENFINTNFDDANKQIGSLRSHPQFKRTHDTFFRASMLGER